MGNFSKEEIITIFKSLGYEALISDEKIINLYTALKIEPKFNPDGTRCLTPYEILGVAPLFDENGNEIPIFIFIKPKTIKIKKRTEQVSDFLFVPKRTDNQNEVLKNLKRQYHSALIDGNLEFASQIFDMVNELTGDAEKELGSICQYLKFYKSMKKQALIDLFAHFFMELLREKSKTIKPGLVKSTKKVWPFKEKNIASQSEVKNLAKSFGINFGDSLNGVRSIKVEESSDDFEETQTVSIEIEKKDKVDIKLPEEKKPEEKKEPIRKSFINRKAIRRLKLRRKRKLFDEQNKISSKVLENN